MAVSSHARHALSLKFFVLVDMSSNEMPSPLSVLVPFLRLFLTRTTNCCSSPASIVHSRRFLVLSSISLSVSRSCFVCCVLFFLLPLSSLSSLSPLSRWTRKRKDRPSVRFLFVSLVLLACSRGCPILSLSLTSDCSYQEGRKSKRKVDVVMSRFQNPPGHQSLSVQSREERNILALSLRVESSLFVSLLSFFPSFLLPFFPS